jgi:hypothetical protein
MLAQLRSAIDDPAVIRRILEAAPEILAHLNIGPDRKALACIEQAKGQGHKIVIGSDNDGPALFATGLAAMWLEVTYEYAQMPRVLPPTSGVFYFRPAPDVDMPALLKAARKAGIEIYTPDDRLREAAR